MLKVGIIGARGYVGKELIELIDVHPNAQLTFAGSRAFSGQKVKHHVSQFSDEDLQYQDIPFTELADHNLDVLFLALPNGIAIKLHTMWQSMSQKTVVIDLSADFRFHGDWVYGQPETQNDLIQTARLIANPGCYATAVQLGIIPLLPYLKEVPTAFGVSGYSGAGTTASDKNDPNRLKDNLLAYQATGHIHEQEVSHVLSQQIRFMPHVASHFRGIHVTLSGRLKHSMTDGELQNLFEQEYQNDALISIQSAPPELQQIAGKHHVVIGGFDCSQQEPGHFVLNVCLDNLLKGAATQAIQNMNLATTQKTQHINIGIYHD
ncbi:N-acetyl-gamma-glutamyl-phosphate reductase [Marinicella rhabdoformis]|uniref:N-acetyl-gamma-glutamyl-phosphate reductase n=1 Tax=Marinicella rhabdoformis TaxID=2580566 RepID=UPI0012AEDDFC|nr:N-acetyl-gamma-glutamyl-phosphate reductase [Marinicella rhabdoformis]